MQLSSARIVLTGASGGLGSALARELAGTGAALLLCGRDPERLQRVASSLAPAADTVAADLMEPSGILRVVHAATEFGVNVLINNAGVGSYGLIERQDWEHVDRVMRTNLLAPMRLTQALLPLLLRQPSAAVVQIGSMFGSLPFPGFTAYSSAKSGLRGFSQALRRELTGSAVEVFHFSPRAIRTELNSEAVRRLNAALAQAEDAPEDVARRIVRGLRGGRHEQHFGFPERMFSWLNAVCPRCIDRGLGSRISTIRTIAEQE
jgi:short-subunit dehydrogenase